MNWHLLSSIAKGAALSLALDDAAETAATSSAAGGDAAAVSRRENRLAGLTSFALAAAVPGPRAALALGKARATTAASGGASGAAGGSALSAAAATAAAATGGTIEDARGPDGNGICVELAKMLSGVRLVRPGLAEKVYAAAGAGAGGGGSGQGMVVKEFVIRCAMTDPQAEVYAAVAR